MQQKQPAKTTACAPQRYRLPETYAEVVAYYLAEHRGRGDQELAWFAGQRDFGKMLEMAVMSRILDPNTGRELRHPHQRRISEAVLRTALETLSAVDLQSCRSFDDLHDLIEESTSKIKGIGPLVVFDVACRIGAWKRPALHPEKIYLHRGTREGAETLGCGHGRKTIDVQDLPPEFHRLTGRQAEDCLCIYKNDLKRIASGLARQ